MSEVFVSLARKWRPRLLSDMVGQTYVVRALQNAMRQSRLHHAFLFTGTRGVGKTTLARIVAMLANCEQRADDDGEPAWELKYCESLQSSMALDEFFEDHQTRVSVGSLLVT